MGLKQRQFTPLRRQAQQTVAYMDTHAGVVRSTAAKGLNRRRRFVGNLCGAAANSRESGLFCWWRRGCPHEKAPCRSRLCRPSLLRSYALQPAPQVAALSCWIAQRGHTTAAAGRDIVTEIRVLTVFGPYVSRPTPTYEMPSRRNKRGSRGTPRRKVDPIAVAAFARRHQSTCQSSARGTWAGTSSACSWPTRSIGGINARCS